MVFEAQTVPLRTDDNGVIRVGNTRVTLETVIRAFDHGETPEEIVTDFPVLTLADVYGIIAYYLNNREVVANYLAREDEDARRVQADVDAGADLTAFRARLLARSQAA